MEIVLEQLLQFYQILYVNNISELLLKDEKTMLPKCIFCGCGCFQYEGAHHIIPQQVRTRMGWTGKNNGGLGQYKVPMCRECHVKFTELVKPLIYLIKHRLVRKIKPEEIEDLVKQVQSSLGKASEK